MKYVLLLTLTSLALCARAQAAPDETAIRSIIQEEVAAWNRGDAVAYAQHIAPDITFTNIGGQFMEGRDAFIKQHERIFQGVYHGSTLQQDIVSLKFVRTDVAIVEVLTAVTGYHKLHPGLAPDAHGRLRTRLLQAVAKQGGSWQVVAYHNVDVKAGIAVPEPE